MKTTSRNFERNSYPNDLASFQKVARLARSLREFGLPPAERLRLLSEACQKACSPVSKMCICNRA